MTVEFSRRLRPVIVGPEGRQERLEATAEERAALAERLGLLGLDALTADLTIQPAPGGLRARGTLRAKVVQACVVTLDPVPQAVEEPLDWRILPLGEEPSDELDEGPDEIESEPDGTVDLGEAAAQSLALALDPYPRAPGAELPDSARDAASSPFAALRGLKPG
ncbi:YceD family protein [Roseomonas sp. WA12]